MPYLGIVGFLLIVMPMVVLGVVAKVAQVREVLNRDPFGVSTPTNVPKKPAAVCLSIVGIGVILLFAGLVTSV